MYKLTILLSICAVLLVVSQGFAEAAQAPGTCGESDHIGIGSDYIIGGSETESNQYPWMVRLPSGCGGSLITDRHILTAKHCLHKKGTLKNPATATDYWKEAMVKVGVHNQDDPNDYLEVPIKEVKWPKKANHDFAMIILDQAVDLTDKKVGTVCLPNGPNEDYKGKKVVAMGWGETIDSGLSGSGQSPVLNHVGLTVSQRQIYAYYLTTEIGNLNNEHQSFCHGDSGGPLVYKNVRTGRWTIIGTAGGYQGDTCLTAYTNIWNKITAHYDWITKILKNTDEDSCQTSNGACIFPFSYRGKTYNGCVKDSRDRAWCQTEENGSRQWWGWCSKQCKMHKDCPYTDTHPTDCPRWKAAGHCTSSTPGHEAWFADNCAKSCNC